FNISLLLIAIVLPPEMLNIIMLFSMYKLMSSNYYFNILEVGFVVLGGLMLVGMILFIIKRYF
ncbi:MAG: hypothetical protein M3000_15370, partial [Bacillus wiedmannii]|nr:hypothetical protein [Bacillus wiedmannii]